MLMIAGGVCCSLTRFWMAIKPPKVVLVLAQDASSMAAPGAAALAHSASRIASPSSRVDAGIGAVVGAAGRRRVDLRERARGVAGKPERLRKVVQSAVL